jgi:hypothetical protein
MRLLPKLPTAVGALPAENHVQLTDFLLRRWVARNRSELPFATTAPDISQMLRAPLKVPITRNRPVASLLVMTRKASMGLLFPLVAAALVSLYYLSGLYPASFGGVQMSLSTLIGLLLVVALVAVAQSPRRGSRPSS